MHCRSKLVHTVLFHSDCTDIEHDFNNELLAANQTNVAVEAGHNVTLACLAPIDAFVEFGTWEIDPEPAPDSEERFTTTYNSSDFIVTISWTTLMTDSAVYTCIYTLQNQQNISYSYNLTVESQYRLHACCTE